MTALEAAYEPSLAVEDYAELVGILLGALSFNTLIGLDLRNATRKRAHWVAGRALILSAVTIQIMNFVENQSRLLTAILEAPKPLNDEIVRNNLFMINTSRVLLCVLTAYFLPRMARPGSEEKWTKIAAIVLAVFIDIFSEMNSIRRSLVKSSRDSHILYSWPDGRPVSQHSFFIPGAIISVTLIWLILLLISAAIASKIIRNITTQNIPIILAEPAENSWKGVEDQVLKSWIVARSCHPESIVARSTLASSGALGVTICILSSIVGWIIQGPKVKFHRNPAFWLKFIITILVTICILSSIVGWIIQGPKVKFHRNPAFWLKFIITILDLLLIAIRWAITGWRWLTSLAYYGRRRQPEPHCCYYFGVDDYWTRHIVDLQDAERLKPLGLKVDERISKMFVTKLKKLKVDERLSKC